MQAPRNGSVELNTVNGPISVRGLTGTVKAKAVNGPLSVHRLRRRGGRADDQRPDLLFRPGWRRETDGDQRAAYVEDRRATFGMGRAWKQAP